MEPLPQMFLSLLAKKLRGLPPVTDGVDPRLREQSWMTVDEIRAWWDEQAEAGPIEIDDARLVEAWKSDPRMSDLKLRPAKYPSLDLKRLWGHEAVVRSCPRWQLEQCRTTPSTPFAGPRLPDDAPSVFCSHSTLDDKFAARVRDALFERGLRPWLCGEQIREGELIFESVREAISASALKLVLMGRNALGSAWVFSETVGGSIPTRFVCDGQDDDLMRLIRSWRPPQFAGEINFDERLLEPLHASYERDWKANRPDHSALEESSGGGSMRQLRPDKYKRTAADLLFAVSVPSIAVYPSGSNDSGQLESFEEALSPVLR